MIRTHRADESTRTLTRLTSLGFIAVIFVTAGIFHFVKPAAFVRVVPPFLPNPLALVYISGVAEILGGIGVLIPSMRAWAGIGLIALLVAVFPANIYMTLAPNTAGMGFAPLWLWLRLPAQLVLISWVWWATLRT